MVQTDRRNEAKKMEVKMADTKKPAGIEKTYDVEQASLAQKAYCKENGYPLFVHLQGLCWSCNKNIYLNEEYTKGYSVELAGSELLTGCPHCKRSYLD